MSDTKINFHVRAREQRKTAESPPRCTCCGNPRKRRTDGKGWQGTHGYCGTCTSRWHHQGRPEGGPAYLSAAERAARISAGMYRHHAVSPTSGRQKAAGRLQDYTWLRSFGESREAAAARVGVGEQHARQAYEPRIAAMSEAAR